MIELIAVLAVLGVALAMWTPALSRTRSDGAQFHCMHNLGQLLCAMAMYSQEDTDYFPPNPDDGNAIAGHNWCQGAAGIAGEMEFNPDILTNWTTCLLAPYLGGQPSVFRCVLDAREGTYTGTDVAWKGQRIGSARSISMNMAVGTVCPGYLSSGRTHSGKPTRPTSGSYLGPRGTTNQIWRTYGRSSDIVAPTPSRLWMLTEEDALSLSDASFLSLADPANAIWVDYPGTQHDFGAVLGFADGHAEGHRWVDPRTRINGNPGQRAAGGSPDWTWLAERTSARKK